MGAQCNLLILFAAASGFLEGFWKRFLPFGNECFREDIVTRLAALDIFFSTSTDCGRTNVRKLNSLALVIIFFFSWSGSAFTSCAHNLSSAIAEISVM